MTLFYEPIPRRPAAMLRDRGVCVDDTFSTPVVAARAVAAHIALGAWCDPLAWEDIVDRLTITSARVVEPELELWEVEV